MLASHQEGLPVALMEAASVGAAIVATAVGGVPQMVTDGVNGLVVPPGDPVLLADALDRMISDPELRARLGRQAMADSARYDIARASAEIEDIYRGLLQPGTEAGGGHGEGVPDPADGRARRAGPRAVPARTRRRARGSCPRPTRSTT